MKTFFSAVIILVTAALVLMFLTKKGFSSDLVPSFKNSRFPARPSKKHSGHETRISLHWFVKVMNLETGKSLIRRLYTLNPDGIYTIGRSDEEDPGRTPDLDFNQGLSLINDPDDDSWLTVSMDQAIIYEDGNGKYYIENRSRMNGCETADTHKPFSLLEIKDGLSILIGDCYKLTFSQSSSFPEKKNNSSRRPAAATRIYTPGKS
jgi:hypothetical protein